MYIQVHVVQHNRYIYIYIYTHICVLYYLHTELEETAQAIGQSCLQYLSVLKREKPGSGTLASSGNDLQKIIRSLGRLAGVRKYHPYHSHYIHYTYMYTYTYAHNWNISSSLVQYKYMYGCRYILHVCTICTCNMHTVTV